MESFRFVGVLGLQEACPDQAQYLKENLAGYEFAGEYRNFPSR